MDHSSDEQQGHATLLDAGAKDEDKGHHDGANVEDGVDAPERVTHVHHNSSLLAHIAEVISRVEGIHEVERHHEIRHQLQDTKPIPGTHVGNHIQVVLKL